MTPQPLNSEPVLGPVEGRGVAEIRADLACCDRDGVPWPAAARRLLADVPSLLAEVEAAHRFERSAAVEVAELVESLERVTEERDAFRDERNIAVAERDSLRGVVQAAQVKLAAVEALLPGNDAEYPIFPFQIREALGAQVSDFLLIPRSALAAAADAPQPQEVQR